MEKTQCTSDDDPKKDLSIVDDDVLEVFELVEDNALEECIMLVKKMSETSLLEIQKEKENLTRHLREADKEVNKLKLSLRNANALNEKIGIELKSEKEKNKELEEQLRNANERLAQMEDDLTQREDEYLEMENKYHEASTLAKETNHLLNQVFGKKNTLEKELEYSKKRQNEFAVTEKKMKKEQDHVNAKLTQFSEKLLKTEAELLEKTNKLDTLEEDFKAQIEHLQEKLNLEKGLNRSLVVEADECVTAIGKKLDSLEKRNLETEKEKNSVITKLNEMVDEMKQSKDELVKQVREKDKRLKDYEKSLEELRKTLHTESLKNAVLRKDQTELELAIKNLENEKCALEKQFSEVQENYNASRNELAAYEEHVSKLAAGDRTSCEMVEYETNDSWANRVTQEEMEAAEDLRQKYAELEMEYHSLSKQFTQTRKHRNEILRQNNELRHQAQMAVVQLASTNRRFVQHMEQLKTQLSVAERVYQEKLFECNLLEIQVQHLMHQINALHSPQMG